ncbi:MAG: hypothetical protein AMXMBFR83_16390 [Phycisphaerae bacterium]
MMTQSLLDEELAPLSRAARWVPPIRGEKHVAPSTLWRWAHRGIRSHRLETVRIGGVTMTSREALGRFFSRCSGRPLAPARGRRLQREHDRAQTALDAIGI